MELTAPAIVVAVVLFFAGMGLFYDTMERASEFSSNEGGARAGLAAFLMGIAGLVFATGVVYF